MSGNHNGPRAGSSVYYWLVRLHENGGRASLQAWVEAAAWKGSKPVFERDAARLVVQRLVRLVGDEYVITEAGMQWIGIDLDVPPSAPALPAGPRYVAPRRELSTNRALRLSMMREGALDYRAIPSLIGGHRLAYGTKA